MRTQSSPTLPDQNRPLDFPIVGIGASAGGITALQHFFADVPADCGMAFVVVLHLSARHESNAAAILQRATSMPVLQVQEKIALNLNHVYVIPHTHDLILKDGCLALLDRVSSSRGPLAIDIFFRTLAQSHAARAICIVLSGMGSDGAVGLTRIKEEGGVTFAQLPEDAEYDSMPRAAIATGHVDFVLPVNEMSRRLLDLWNNAKNIELPAADISFTQVPPGLDKAPITNSSEALNAILALLQTRTHHDFRQYKKATVLRRLERRLQVRGLPNLVAYHDYLNTHLEETPLLLQDMLISVTEFFRDHECFQALEREVIHNLFANRSDNDVIRVWVVGCASGEEAYSISILLREHADRLGSQVKIQLFATDIDERAIATARAGIYPGAIIADVAPSRLNNYFTREQDFFRVTKTIRETVLFATHNVMSDPPFSRLDLICCRNLLIYLDRDAQQKILETLHFSLKSSGYLFLGSSETDDSALTLFSVVDKKNRIYRANSHGGSARSVPVVTALPTDERIRLPRPAHIERRRQSFEQIHQRALQQHQPPSILLDDEYNILHVTGSAALFLEHQGGVPTHELLSNIQRDFRPDLRTALFKAVQFGDVVETSPIRIGEDGSFRFIKVSVRSYIDPVSEGKMLLLTFLETPAAASSALVDSTAQRLVGQLEKEIDGYKQDLQKTIAHSETSTHELKASNEELQAINEELRSTTEELETGKEELQSMNEELISLNSELKLKVDETDTSNDLLNNLIASTEIATIFVDRTISIVRFTPRATELFKLIPSDVGRSLSDIRHQLEYDSLADDAADAFENLRILERKIRSVEDRYYLVRVLPYRAKDNKIEGAVLTFIDITALHRAEEKILEGEERLRFAAETTSDYIILTMDEAGAITTWNTGAARAFGYSEAEVLGTSLAIIFTPEDRAQGVPGEQIQLARSQGRSEDDRWLQRKNGSIFFCSGVLSSIDYGGRTGYVIIARDMTGSKRLEAERDAQLIREKDAREKMQMANKMKDEFLAVMSHELKHPLNLIHVNAELLAHLPEIRDVPAVARAAETIRRTVLSQAKIIDDLLDLSRARTGKLTLNLSATILDEPVAEIVRAAQENANNKDIKIDFLHDEGPTTAICDWVRVEQILWNLLSNAIKFTPPGGAVSLRLARNDGFVRLIVTDTGEGIAQSDLQNVFEMFNQGNRPRAGAEVGLGIGLALVRELAIAQGGYVQAESPGPGMGATFTVSLPTSSFPNSNSEPVSSGKNIFDGLRVLVVDDSPDALESFAKLLTVVGAAVKTASSGAQALEILDNNVFDLLISDIGMHDMDGYDLISYIRVNPSLQSLTAVALTGYGRQEDEARALQHGFNAHIPKPTSFSDLRRIVEGLCR